MICPAHGKFKIITCQNGLRITLLYKPICKFCHKQIRSIGTKLRKYYNMKNKKSQIRIQRFRCDYCKVVENVLPPFLLPYKRHSAGVIEQALDAASWERLHASQPASDDEPMGARGLERRTFDRLRSWWSNVQTAVLSSLARRRARFPFPDEPPARPLAEFRVTNGWPSRIVHELVNHRFWPGPVPPLPIGRPLF
jgi:hypothetical protein